MDTEEHLHNQLLGVWIYYPIIFTKSKIVINTRKIMCSFSHVLVHPSEQTGVGEDSNPWYPMKINQLLVPATKWHSNY